MIVVVDTNIVFSAILNSSSGIGKLLLTQNRHFDFYTCDYLLVELYNHRSKLLRLTKLPEEELEILSELVVRNISFINEKLIPQKHFKKAFELTKGIDVDDSPFLALTLHLKGLLWTGDIHLVKGLRKKGVESAVTTKELLAISNGMK